MKLRYKHMNRGKQKQKQKSEKDTTFSRSALNFAQN